MKKRRKAQQCVFARAVSLLSVVHLSGTQEEREEGSIVFAAIGASVDIRFRFGR